MRSASRNEITIEDKSLRATQQRIPEWLKPGVWATYKLAPYWGPCFITSVENGTVHYHLAYPFQQHAAIAGWQTGGSMFAHNDEWEPCDAPNRLPSAEEGKPECAGPFVDARDCPVHRKDVLSTEERSEGRLTKPALVGNTRFGVGVSERMVIERAQREYEYQVTPEKEAARIARAKQAVARISGAERPELPPDAGVFDGEAHGLYESLTQSPSSTEPLTDSFVQTVPDKCDRIVWRNRYYHLPIAPSATRAPLHIIENIRRQIEQITKSVEEEGGYEAIILTKTEAQQLLDAFTSTEAK